MTDENLIRGMRQTLPLAPSFIFFGLILGFTSAQGGLSWLVMASTGIIIFAGSAQFITVILLIDNEPLVFIAITAIILNLRHLLYGAVMNKMLPIRKLRHLIFAYFLTDESFLLTNLHNKSNSELDQNMLEHFYIGSAITLWTLWNLSMSVGYFISNSPLLENLNIPNNFLISATFVGYLVNHWQKFPTDRLTMIFASIVVIILAIFGLTTSSMLLYVMVFGAVFAIAELYTKNKEGVN